MSAPFSLAVAQAPAELDGAQARFDWLNTILPDVAARGADLLLLPELFACGYNIAADMAARAEQQDGPAFDTMRALARDHGVALHYGYAERAGRDLFNAATCIGADGTRLVHQRKLMIPPGFEQDCFQPGTGCALFSYRGLRFATLICFDAEFPETVRHVAQQGADVVLVPTALGADWAWVARQMIPTRAFENGIYLAYANSAGVERGMLFLGASVIAAPDGAELARAGSGPEVLYAPLSRDRVRRAQDRLPYLKDIAGLKF